MNETVDKSVYEGAGFLLYHEQKDSKGKTKMHIILGERQKKPEDEAKDPSSELEYMGGKPEQIEVNGQMIPENAERTGENEVNEEVGCFCDSNGALISILQSDWIFRAEKLYTFQPISQKWIVCFVLKLTDVEFERFKVQDQVVSNWPVAEKRDFSSLTGRKALCRKSLKALYSISVDEFKSKISEFSTFARTENRLKDAKQYNKTCTPFTAHRLTDETKLITCPLRAFNLVIFEQHVSNIIQIMTPVDMK